MMQLEVVSKLLSITCLNNAELFFILKTYPFIQTNLTNTHSCIHGLVAYPEQAGEPAVLHCIIQIEVVVEVALQWLLLFLITNPTKQHRSACWAHRQGETRARRGLVTRGTHPRPGPLLWRMEKQWRQVTKNSWILVLTSIIKFFVPLSSLPSRFRRNMSEWMVPFSTSFLTL